MALVLSDVISAARSRHPLFAKQWTPNKVFADFLTDAQRTLVSKAIQRDSTYLLQQASVIVAPSAANAVGTVGAGTVGGLPGSLSADGTVVSAVASPTGTLLEVDTADAPVLVGETVVTSATSTTLSHAGSAWSTNAYVGDVVEIVAGTGQGQVRSIAANTANQVTVAAWTIQPDTTSVFRIVALHLAATETVGVVASFPTTAMRQGFIVRLNAQGAPYLDLTQPLIASFDVGVPLPPMKRLVGGTVRFRSDTTRQVPVTLVSYGDRLRAAGAYVAWTAMGTNGPTLFLSGTANDWQDVASIDLRFIPEPPALTALTDYLLLPETARPALVTRCAYQAALRINGLPDAPQIDVSSLAADAQEAEAQWLAEIGAGRRMHTHRIRETW